MLAADQVLALLGVMFLISVVPGPSDVAVVARSIAAGFRQAAFMVLGIVLADAVFIAAAIFGLSLLKRSVDGAFESVQLISGCYLVWLGFLQLRTDKSVTGNLNQRAMAWSGFLAGFMITLADPKALLFYMGLFPLFIDVSSASSVDALVVLALATGVIITVKLAYALLAQRAARWLQDTSARRWLDWLAALSLVGLGVFILLRVWLGK